MRLGLTFSPSNAIARGLAWQSAYQQILDLAPALVRIGAYWSEIEATQGVCDFSTLDWLLDQAQQRQQSVVMSVGMKAPRWPEFYLPAWLGDVSSITPEVQLKA